MKSTLFLFFTFFVVFQNYSQEEVLPSNPISEKVVQDKEEIKLLKQREREEKAAVKAEKNKVKLEKDIVSRKRAISKAEEKEIRLRTKLTQGNSRGRHSPMDIMKLNRQINKQKSSIERDKIRLAKMEAQRQ